MNELHLFAGAGGGILGGILLGHTCVCAVEIEPYPRKVLLQRQRDGILPRFPIWDDICTFDGKPWRGKVDVVCGGFPCQDISAAGKGAGITGERSGLWGEMARVISEVRPRHIFIENSPLLVGRGLAVVLCDLAKMGYDARWGVIGGRETGLPHARERLWIYGSNANDIGSKGLLEKSSLPRKENGAKHQLRLMGGGKIWDEWQNQSDRFGDCDGVAYRVDRLTAVGNGQIPQVAALAWQILSGDDNTCVCASRQSVG
jgi:DNA (cytosine-5)-methyltransferase 1